MATKFVPKIEKHDDGSFTIRLTLPKDDLAAEFDRQLLGLQQSFNLKGFRPGKVPLDIVRKHYSEAKIFHQALSALISTSYQHIIQENQLQLVVPPKIKIATPPSLKTDCQVEIHSAGLPAVNLPPNYLELIKKSKDRFNAIIKLSTTKFSPILIDFEVENRLIHLLTDLSGQKLNLVDYLRSQNLNLTQLQQQLENSVKNELTLHLALTQIAQNNHIDINKVVDFINSL